MTTATVELELPRTAKDVFRLTTRDRIVYAAVINVARVSGAWRYPIAASGDLETMRLKDRIYWLYKAQYRFPMGTLKSGNGGFNTPWTWHLDPDSVRLVEVAIELCDGRPSYVESHQSDYASYCPWGARVVSRR